MPLNRPAKLRLVEGGRYLACRTRDVSAGGCLLELEHPQLLMTGQTVDLAIAWQPNQPLILSEQIIRARVVRCLGLSGRQQLALVFAEPQALRATA